MEDEERRDENSSATSCMWEEAALAFESSVLVAASEQGSGQACACVSFVIARCPSAKTIRTLKRIKVHYFQDPEITHHTWGKVWRQRVGLGLRFYWDPRQGSRVLWTLLVNSKYESRNVMLRKRKNRWPKVAGYCNQPRFPKQMSLSGGRGWQCIYWR